MELENVTPDNLIDTTGPIAHRLIRARKCCGMSQEEAAQWWNMPVDAVRSLERGTRCNRRCLENLSYIYSVSLHWILTGVSELTGHEKRAAHRRFLALGLETGEVDLQMAWVVQLPAAGCR